MGLSDPPQPKLGLTRCFFLPTFPLRPGLFIGGPNCKKQVYPWEQASKIYCKTERSCLLWNFTVGPTRIIPVDA
ncbi:unnamed protein product [Allacma fusca]|uniref:Uncharacterized protein n=1 Tax=Allacma fusca TaxID=39272 RepID=A0A8J2NZS3_9HEXA|nr:unnamed protein product [Allacma fusca]